MKEAWYSVSRTHEATSSCHPMVTRSRDGTRKPKTYLTIKHPLPQCFHAALSPSEPTCYTQTTQ